MSDALAGWILLAGSAIWAGRGIRAVIVSRRAAATSGRRQRVQKWQWLCLALLQMTSGTWIIANSASRQNARITLWILAAGFGALLIWMVAVDVGPWLRSRVQGSSSNQPS